MNITGVSSAAASAVSTNVSNQAQVKVLKSANESQEATAAKLIQSIEQATPTSSASSGGRLHVIA